MKLLGKEFILQIQSLPYPAQQVIENEVVMARSQYHIVKQIRHGNKITDSQYKPHTEYTKQHPAQLVQVVPKG